MADDKKPKIDLKARLQKMGGPGAPTPAPAAVVPVQRPSAPPPMARGIGAPPPSVPPPSGIPKPPMSSRPVALDANNPLAAAAGLRPPSAPAPAIAQPQRIEVDEVAVQQARSGARKQGFIGGLVLAVITAVVAYVAGTAHQQGSDRNKSITDAHDLAGDLLKAKDSLDQIQKKVTEGGTTLMGATPAFPKDLGQALAGMTVDFSGDKLFGRRFSGVPADTTRGLMDFITRVQGLNDKKDLVVALLSKLEKPITEQLARKGQEPISIVAVVDKDTPGGALRLAALVTPLDPGKDIPSQLLFSNPIGQGNVQLPWMKDAKIPRDGAAIPVIPTSFDRVCPSMQKGAVTQLLASMNSLVDDIQGQKGSDSGDIVTDSKPGLSETAGKLADQLSKVN
ncbi:MAG TPA: hypothetical protein VF765_26290 [Polyangiaceae bacterium]